MDGLLEALAGVAGAGLGTVVHVGAGAAGVIDVYRQLPRERVLLIEGDPDTGAELQRLAGGASWAEVCTQPVAAVAGPVDWRSYNLPALNGPLDAMALARYFPRLRARRVQQQQALGFAELLARLTLSADAEQPNVLVCDVPGQEAALLAAVPPEVLAHFAVVLLRGCRETLPPSGAPAQRAVQDLRARGWTLQGGDVDPAAALWPMARLDFDRQRHALLADMQRQAARVSEIEADVQLRAARIAELEAAVLQRDERLAQVEADLQQRDQRLADAESSLRLRDEQIAGFAAGLQLRDQRIVELDAACREARSAADTQLQLATGREAGLQAATSARDASVQANAALEARVAELAAALESQARGADERLAAVRAEGEAALAAHDAALRQQLAEASQRLADLQQQLQSAEQQLAAAHGAAGRQVAADPQASAVRPDLHPEFVDAQLAAVRAEAGRSLVDATQREADLQQRLQSAERQLAAAHAAIAAAQTEAAQRDAAWEQRLREADHRQQQLQVDAQAQRDALQHSVTAAQADAAGTADALRRQLDQAHQSAAIALRLQLLRESDLKQLQDRYQTSQGQLRDQNDLLAKLAQRLSLANQYFLQLSQESGPIVTPSTARNASLAADESPLRDDERAGDTSPAA